MHFIILKNSLNAPLILDFDSLKAKQATASGVLQQIANLYF